MAAAAASPQHLAAALMAVLLLIAAAEAQTPSCASQLIPCAPFLNSTKPPASCCDPLKETVTKELTCLCNLYKNPDLLKSLGVNVTQALQLPKQCGISNDVSVCDKASTPTTSPSSPGTSPATPSKNPPSGNTPSGNGVGRIAWTGVSSFVLLGASLML